MAPKTIEEFGEARSALLDDSLMSVHDLRTLRGRVDAVMDGSEFCDGCGFCCLENVPMLRCEFTRIDDLVQQDPGLLRLQGFVCPFLELDVPKFDQNLSIYGHRRQELHSFPCRIYAERPLVCRLFPAPSSIWCRNYNLLKSPDLMQTLLVEDRERFPTMLIQKYFLTLMWEQFNLPHEADLELEHQVVPGWLLDTATGVLQQVEGPTWTPYYGAFPNNIPGAKSCVLQHEAMQVFQGLRAPRSIRSVLEEFGCLMPAGELGTLLTQWQLLNIVVPVDIARRMNRKSKSFWNHKADLSP